LDTGQRIILVVLLVGLLTLGGTVGLYLLSKGNAPTTSSTGSNQPLPAGCVKPAGGFLIIASASGYNDSIEHGAPAKSWPILDVAQGQNVTIVVCNVDHQSHGFQIEHYYDSSEVTVQPGEVLRVPSFVATEAGNFEIICDIPCTIHPYMQSGLLTVSA
jgi:hypothetical protein